MCHVWGRGETHTRFSWADPRDRNVLEELGVDGKITLKWIF